jgi:hypothetical protein
MKFVESIKQWIKMLLDFLSGVDTKVDTFQEDVNKIIDEVQKETREIVESLQKDQDKE